MQELLINPETVSRLNALAVKHCKDIFNEINAYNPKSWSEIEKKWEVEKYNRDSFLRLYELYTTEKDWPVGNGGDPIAREAIRKKLVIFKSKINISPKIYQALMLDFSQYQFNEKERSVVAELNEDWTE